MRRYAPGLGVMGGVLVSWSGFHWDIALHGDLGRERFITTPHLIVVAGMVLQGCFAVWGLSRVADGTGVGAMLRARPGLALGLAAPLVNSVVLWFDNRWHELFGLDVTLWSPPHLLLVLGFVDALLGGIIDLAQQGLPRVPLALITGSLFGILTIVDFEFDIGYPHFAVRWLAPVMGFVLLSILALTATATGVRWPGLLLIPGSLALRLFGLGLNTVVHRSLPTLPLGLMAGAVAFDLLRRRDGPGRIPGPLVVAGTWVVAYGAEFAWLRAVGKTWWNPGDVVVGLLAGLVTALLGAALGGRLGQKIRGLADGEEPAPARPLRYGVVVVGCAGLLFTAGLPLLTLSRVGSRQAELVQQGGRAELRVPGATADDWVSVFTRHNDRDGYRWTAALHWEDGRFVGDVPDSASVPYLAYWYVDGIRPFIGVSYGSGKTTLDMVPDYFTPALESSRSAALSSLALVVLLFWGITAPLRFALTTAPTRSGVPISPDP